MNSSLRVTSQTRIATIVPGKTTSRSAGAMKFGVRSKSDLADKLDRIETRLADNAQTGKAEALVRYKDKVPLIATLLPYQGERIDFTGPQVLQLFKIALDKKSFLHRLRKGPVFAHQLIPGFCGQETLYSMNVLTRAGFLRRHQDFRDAYFLTREGEKELKNIARNEAKDSTGSR